METADERGRQGKLAERVRELERLLGRKTLEVEILKEALDLARAKKPTLAVALAGTGRFPHRARPNRKLDGRLQHRSPALAIGLPFTPRAHRYTIAIRCVSGLIGSIH